MTALLVAAVAIACGRTTDRPGANASAAPTAPPPTVVDTSTPDDWKANCAARYLYRNELIFSATESTVDGRKVGTLSTSRAQYVETFAKLKLDGVPDLKAKRDQIVAMAGKAPGGARIGIVPELYEADRNLWDEVVRLGRAHGVDCLALEKK